MAPCVAVARACVCVCVCVCVRVCVCATHRSDCARLLFVSAFFLNRAREATRDRATHSNDCARPTAGCVAAVVVAAVAVVAAAARASVCVCVCVCACVALSRSSPRSSAQSRDAWHRLRPIGGEAGGGGGRGGGGGGRGGVRGGGVCVCVCVCLWRAREATRHRATHIGDRARPQHARAELARASCASPRRTAIVAALCGTGRHAPLRVRRGSGPNTQLWARICAELEGSVV